MRQTEFLIIGGGAAGLLAAYAAGDRVHTLVVDGNRKLGKKLLATGNGRCNLTNLSLSPQHYHGDVLAQTVLDEVPTERVLDVFEEMGLLCRADSEGRVYPRSLQAAAVLNALERSLPAQTECLCETEVTALNRSKNGFVAACANGEQIAARQVLLACGGMASPVHSTGSGYDLAKQLGHTVTAVSPSLTALRVEGKVCKALKGMRCKARVALCQNGKEIYAESGEVIFGDGQISGICIFNLSARLRDSRNANCEVSLDLAEDMTEEELVSYFSKLCARYPDTPAKELCAGLLNLRVGQELLKGQKFTSERTLGSLSPADLRRVAFAVKHWVFTVVEAADLKEAQVTAGGVPLEEVNLKTMESKRCAGLYLVGELLNVDGDCGGYNLHWAWSTALLAAEAVKEAFSC